MARGKQLMATPEIGMAVDEAKMGAFMGKMVGELGAAMQVALVLVGDRLGLYKAMSGAGPLTSSQLAAKTGTDERYVREWLNANAAGEFVMYDSQAKTYTLPNEQAMALAVEDSPFFLAGAFDIIAAMVKDEPKITEAF